MEKYYKWFYKPNCSKPSKSLKKWSLQTRGGFVGSLRCWISQAFSTEVEELGDSEASALLISGSLIRVKGWWRKGARDWDLYRKQMMEVPL